MSNLLLIPSNIVFISDNVFFISNPLVILYTVHFSYPDTVCPNLSEYMDILKITVLVIFPSIFIIYVFLVLFLLIDFSLCSDSNFSASLHSSMTLLEVDFVVLF